ncbi:MAG: hypothetical protein GPJ54_03485 [Candidatus Heimdallarchaeota archaeon]|nr:hypothetical protein [Candidatus Heimdallarchaeota archaeon]
MTDECKELNQLAKGLEKENPDDAIELYKQAAHCFNSNNKPKDCDSSLIRAAKILREKAKSKEDPDKALRDYEQSSSIYNDIGKTVDAGKVMHEAYQKFINVAKIIRSEGKKLDDVYLADQKFRLASKYALQGKNELLSYECWIDSGDKFREFANNIQDPTEASEFYKQAIMNYRKGQTQDGEIVTLKNQAEKFSKTAETLYKKKKDLVFAFDNSLHAATIYSQINSEEKALINTTRMHEIAETIGITKDSLIEYLIRQEVKPNSIFKGILSNQNIDKQKDKLTNTDIEDFKHVEDIKEQNIEYVTEEVPKSTLDRQLTPAILEENNFDSEFGKAIKERRRSELRQNKVNPSRVNIVENKTSAEIENIFEITLDEPIEDILPDISDSIIEDNKVSDTVTADPIIDKEIVTQFDIKDPATENEDKPEMSLPIVEFLRNQGYITKNLTSEKDLFQIPEYQILSNIIKLHPITLDQIEDITELGSISLVLSNLQADALIIQTNDYQWTISENVKNNLI